MLTQTRPSTSMGRTPKTQTWPTIQTAGDSMDDTPDIDGELAALIAATTFQCEAYTVERCRLMLHPACDGIENRDTDLGTVSAVLGHDGNFGTEEECVAAYTAPLCLAMLSGVELGFRGFDETAGAMCLSWLQEVSCETYYSENAELLELNGCNDVQVPLQDTGDPCIATQDCSPPDVCPGERSPFVYHAFPDTEYVYGECQPPQVEGEACTSDIHCAEGLVCSTATRRCAPEPTEE